MRYGSDLIVDHLDALGIELVTLNPGASIRGLHDSLVRTERPRMMLALHEEIAVGMAHGYAKATGTVAAVLVHDLVGLQHASMAVFNAWADQVPMLVIGGSGPRDAMARRPWIDWVHTGLPQGSLVRDFVKWDDEPGSLAAVPASLERALEIATRRPCGPVYVSIDVGLQECRADGVVFPAPAPVAPSTVAAPVGTVEALARDLASARRPLVVLDLPQPGLAAAVAELAALTGADVVDLGGGANFPTEHPANATHRRRAATEGADLVLVLHVRDVAWAIGTTDQRTRRVDVMVGEGVPVVAVSLSDLQLRGFVSARSHVPRARNVVGDPVQLAEDLVAALRRAGRDTVGPTVDAGWPSAAQARANAREIADAHAADGVVHPATLAAAVWDAVRGGPWQLANGKLDGWVYRLWDVTSDDQFLGLSGGHGLGYGLPASLGAGVAHLDDDTVVVNLQGDGDLMYVPSALWTAARYRLPVLTVVQNNRSYGRDEMHQRMMARDRGRSEDLVGVGIQLDEPDISYVRLAEAQGVLGLGPVTDPRSLPGVLAEAVRVVRTERRPVLVDVVCALTE